MLTTKVDGVASPEEFQFKRRLGNGRGAQPGQRPPQPRQVGRVGEDGEVRARLNSAAP